MRGSERVGKSEDPKINIQDPEKLQISRTRIELMGRGGISAEDGEARFARTGCAGNFGRGWNPPVPAFGRFGREHAGWRGLGNRMTTGNREMGISRFSCDGAQVLVPDGFVDVQGVAMRMGKYAQLIAGIVSAEWGEGFRRTFSGVRKRCSAPHSTTLARGRTCSGSELRAGGERRDDWKNFPSGRFWTIRLETADFGLWLGTRRLEKGVSGICRYLQLKIKNHVEDSCR